MLMTPGPTAVPDEVREAMGLDVFPVRELSSPTATAFHLPGRAKDGQAAVENEHDITLATGLGAMAETYSESVIWGSMPISKRWNGRWTGSRT